MPDFGSTIVRLIKIAVGGLASLVSIDIISWYNSKQEREQNEKQHKENIALQKRLLELQQGADLNRDFVNGFLRYHDEVQLYEYKKASDSYPLGVPGELGKMLESDSFPAILVSEIFSDYSDLPTISIRPYLSGLLSNIEIQDGYIHECSGALKLTPKGQLSTITGKFQALNVCMNEFQNRPAIIIYHERGPRSLHSYALLWNFFSIKSSTPSWMQIKVGDFVFDTDSDDQIDKAVDSLQKALYGKQFFLKAWQNIRLPAKSNLFIEEFITHTCLSVICASIDAYFYLTTQKPPSLFNNYVSDLPYTSPFFSSYAQSLLLMKAYIEKDATETVIPSHGDLFNWLQSEIDPIYDSGYTIEAEELSSGEIAMKVKIDSHNAVLVWIPREFRSRPPKPFWFNGHEIQPYEISFVEWSRGPHLADIVEAIKADNL